MKFNQYWLIAVILIACLIIPNASAIEWDNVKSYDAQNREVTIIEVFGLGADIAKIKLNSDLDVKVGAGYQKVAEFEIDSYSDYKGAIASMNLYNLKDNSKEISRKIDYKYRTVETLLNETTNQPYEIVSWKDLDSMDINYGKTIIGLFTDVQHGDKIEWIPTLFGVKVEEWASWTETFNAEQYYAGTYWYLDYYWELSNTEAARYVTLYGRTSEQGHNYKIHVIFDYYNGTTYQTPDQQNDGGLSSYDLHNFTSIYPNNAVENVTIEIDGTTSWGGYKVSIMNRTVWGEDVPLVANVTLNAPVDYYNSSQKTITFNCTAIDPIGIENVSIYINGTVNQSNSSGYNNTDYIFTTDVNLGYYNWTCEECNNQTPSICSNLTGHFSFVPPVIAPCNATYNVPTLNFSTIDETNISRYVNETNFKVTFVISGTSDMLFNQTYSYEIDNNPLSNFSFCIYPNSTSYVNANIEYGGTDWMTKNYYLLAAPINNTSQQINLYMLNSSLGTNLVVKVLDSDLVPEESITVQMQRYFPATNTWMQVGSGISDSLGQTVMQVIPLTTDYKFILSNSTGTVVYSTTSMKIVCYATPCVINLVIPSTTATNIYKYYQGIVGLSYSLDYNDTLSRVIMTWADTTGLATQMRLNVQQINISQNRTICDNTSVSTASGTLVCGLGNVTGTYLAQTFRTASPENRLQSLVVTIGNAFTKFGDEGMFWTIIFFITLVMIGVWNPTVAIGLGIFAFVPIALFGMAAMNYAVIITLIVLGGIVISQLKT